MSHLNALTNHGCPPDIAAQLAPHLEAHEVDAAKLVPAVLLPNLNWAGLLGLVQKFGLPLIQQVLAGLFPTVAPLTPVSTIPGASPRIPNS